MIRAIRMVAVTTLRSTNQLVWSEPDSGRSCTAKASNQFDDRSRQVVRQAATTGVPTRTSVQNQHGNPKLRGDAAFHFGPQFGQSLNAKSLPQLPAPPGSGDSTKVTPRGNAHLYAGPGGQLRRLNKASSNGDRPRSYTGYSRISSTEKRPYQRPPLEAGAARVSF